MTGNVLGYSAASGDLVPLNSGSGGTNAFPTGNEPSAVVVDPAYPYVYVANSLDATVTAYSMSSGALTSLGNYTTGLQPVAIGKVVFVIVQGQLRHVHRLTPLST